MARVNPCLFIMKYLGFGLGLRPQHYQHIQNNKVKVDWFEALTENYFGTQENFGGPPLINLLKIREKFPIVLHGVSLSIAGSEPFNPSYLKKMKDLIDIVQPAWVSDHICWSRAHQKNLHDLLPIPFTKKMLNHLSSRIDEIQSLLKRRIVFENVSTYLEFAENEMPEWEFVSQLTKASGCSLLLDVNNIYVNSRNHNFNSLEYIRAIPRDSVVQFHLAGAKDKGDFLIDTHDRKVREEVWALYQLAVKRFGRVSTMIEWDENIPEFSVLEEELKMARTLANLEKEDRNGLGEISSLL